MQISKIDKMIHELYNITDEKKLTSFKSYLYFFAYDISLNRYSEQEVNNLIEKYSDDILINSEQNELRKLLVDFNSFLGVKLFNKKVVKKEKKVKIPYEGCIDVFHINWNGSEYTLTSINTGQEIAAGNKIDKRQLKNAISKNKIVILKDFNGRQKYRIVKNKIKEN